MKYFGFFWCVCIIVVHLGASIASASPPVNFSDMKFSDLHSRINRLKELQLVKGHFDGGKWDDRVDRWQGEKHQLMLSLADVLIQQRSDYVVLKDFFGEPDSHISSAQSRLPFQRIEWRYRRPVTLVDYPARSQLYIYNFRGAHDRCIFLLVDDEIVGYGWWHAYE